MSKLNREIALAAIDGFEVQKQRLDQQIAELRTILNGDAPQSTRRESESVHR